MKVERASLEQKTIDFSLVPDEAVEPAEKYGMEEPKLSGEKKKKSK